MHEQINLALLEAGRRFWEVSAKPAAAMRAAGVAFFPESELIVSRPGGKGKGGGWRGGGGRGRHDDDEEGGGDGGGGGGERKLFLKLAGPREPSSSTSLDDIYVVAARADELSRPMLLRSLWHGPGASGMLEVRMVQQGAIAPRNGLRVCALRGPNGSDWLAQLEMLEVLALPRALTLASSPPLLRSLLSPSTAPPPPPFALAFPRGAPPNLDALLAAALSAFGLNEEQEAVLRGVAEWLRPGPGGGSGGGGPPSTLLVHGVFGSGKSHLLVCILSFLRDALRGATRGGKPVRVLLAALTNVAVDNVIGALIARSAEGEDPGVLRVGSLRRIAAAVLPHSTHGRLGAEDEASAKRELGYELERAAPSGRPALRRAIAEIDSGRMLARSRAASKAVIVGATCAATALPVMASLHFDLVLLDEAASLSCTPSKTSSYHVAPPS